MQAEGLVNAAIKVCEIVKLCRVRVRGQGANLLANGVQVLWIRDQMIEEENYCRYHRLAVKYQPGSGLITNPP